MSVCEVKNNFESNLNLNRALDPSHSWSPMCDPTEEEEAVGSGRRQQQYALHSAVFHNDLKLISNLLRHYDIQLKDIHGNSPLHLAVMLGHKECVQLLLAHSAPVKCKNIQGWTPLAEAISYGDRQTIAVLLRKLKRQSRELMDSRRPNLIRALNQMQNFKMELKWDFTSWVPLVSRILPSDVCRIHKKGSAIRLDTTLVDFSDMKWERGDISFLFSGDAKPSHSLTVVDNRLKVYQRVRYEETEAEVEDEVDLLMSSDIVSAQMSTKSITFSRAQSGWLWREDRSEMVGTFMSDFYSIGGLYLESRKRREHLSDEDLQKNKAIIESLTRGGANASSATNTAIGDDIDASVVQSRRKSVTPPPLTAVTWDEYINAPPGQHRPLGREPLCKETMKAFKATLAMSQDFPLSVDSLLSVLEVIAPFKHFNKLRQFVQMKLPPGFPVKIDIPILPTVTAKITFLSFQLDDDISDQLFAIPQDYTQDQNRFPDL